MFVVPTKPGTVVIARLSMAPLQRIESTQAEESRGHRIYVPPAPGWGDRSGVQFLSNQPPAKLQGSCLSRLHPNFQGVGFGSAAVPIAPAAIDTIVTSVHHSRTSSTTHSLIHSFHTNPSSSKPFLLLLLLLLFEILSHSFRHRIFKFKTLLSPISLHAST